MFSLNLVEHDCKLYLCFLPLVQWWRILIWCQKYRLIATLKMWNINLDALIQHTVHELRYINLLIKPDCVSQLNIPVFDVMGRTQMIDLCLSVEDKRLCCFCFLLSRTTASRPLRPVSSSSVCLRTPARPSWRSGCVTPSTTAAPSTWTTTCSPETWTTPRAPTRTTEAGGLHAHTHTNKLLKQEEPGMDHQNTTHTDRHHCTRRRKLPSRTATF